MRAALAIALALCGCAHVPRDSPQYRACIAVCHAEGFPLARVTEDADAFDCECRKLPTEPPDPI